MKLKENNTQPIAINLKNAAEAYKLASTRISSDLLSKYLDQLAEEKELLLAKIFGDESLAKTDREILNTDHKDVRFYRTNGKIERILVQCLDYEEELIKAYQKALTLQTIGDESRHIFQKLLNNSLASYNHLKMIKESRHYNTKI